MTLRERITVWFAQPDPEVDPCPDSAPPIPDSLFVPGDTHRYQIPMPGEEHGRPNQDDKR